MLIKEADYMGKSVGSGLSFVVDWEKKARCE